ncbi:MAG: hypothetical protein LBN95_06110, partial [Prevotellaceae bacterium]|nr:hypothetical protein [Prevotellaceae bacterium]
LIRQICADFIKISLARAYNKCPVFCCFSAENITKLTKSLHNFCADFYIIMRMTCCIPTEYVEN